MVASELRIGNWIDYFGKKVIVNQIKKDNSKYYLWCIKKPHEIASIYQVIDAFEPIPLTEEILIKVGFDESLVKGWDYTIRLSALHLRARKSCGNIYFELEDIYFGDTNLKYLHQLQNFFHSITGQELNVKL